MPEEDLMAKYKKQLASKSPLEHRKSEGVRVAGWKFFQAAYGILLAVSLILVDCVSVMRYSQSGPILELCMQTRWAGGGQSFCASDYSDERIAICQVLLFRHSQP